MNKNIKIIIIKKNNLEKLPNYLEKYNISKKNDNIDIGIDYFKFFNIFIIKYKNYIIILIILFIFIKIYLKK
tara:strand:- start:237 stop:452 length:216 start_codon:yes stop_codon:yes gene_type:complete